MSNFHISNRWRVIKRKRLSMNQEAPFVMRPDSSGSPFISIGFGADTGACGVDCVHELIRERAYELFESRGRVPGHDLDDWLRAEHEIKHHLQLP